MPQIVTNHETFLRTIRLEIRLSRLFPKRFSISRSGDNHLVLSIDRIIYSIYTVSSMLDLMLGYSKVPTFSHQPPLLRGSRTVSSMGSTTSPFSDVVHVSISLWKFFFLQTWNHQMMFKISSLTGQHLAFLCSRMSFSHLPPPSSFQWTRPLNTAAISKVTHVVLFRASQLSCVVKHTPRDCWGPRRHYVIHFICI